MKIDTFTDFDAFRATNAQLDGQRLINGGEDWRWSTESIAVGACQILRCYSHTGLVIEGVASEDVYGFYIPFKGGVWRNNGVGFNEDEVVVLESGAEHCETSKIADGWQGFFVPKQLPPIAPETRGDRARCSYTIKTQQQFTETVRNLFKTVIAAAAENPRIESTPAAKMAEAELRSLLEPLLGNEEDGPDHAQGRPQV